MSTHTIYEESDCFYFVTFACFKWLPLIEESNLYEYILTWFKNLKQRGGIVCGYVIMPNHIHLLIYVDSQGQGLNKLMGNAKRFLAYKIVKRLERNKKYHLLEILEKGVQTREKNKGKKHQVFRLSFDAKLVEGDKSINKVLDYMHNNPLSGKWELAKDYVDYQYSSAGFTKKTERICLVAKIIETYSNPLLFDSESSSADEDSEEAKL